MHQSAVLTPVPKPTRSPFPSSVLGGEEGGPLAGMAAEYRQRLPEHGAAILADSRLPNSFAQVCHPLALMLAVGGEVAAVTMHPTPWRQGSCVLEFANGAVGALSLIAGPPPPLEHYWFWGKWRVTIDNCSRVTVRRGIPFTYGRTTSLVPEGLDSGEVVWEPQNTLATLENKALFTHGFFHEMRYFCDCVLAARPAQRGSLEFTLNLMRVYEAALRSEGSRVALG